MSSNLDVYKKKLKEAGYKLTPQRIAIIEAVEKSVGKHLSAEEIYDIVKSTNADLGLATVYRTTQLLEELDIVSSLNIGDGKVRYELYVDDGHHNHHHIICNECGSIEEFQEDLLDQLEERIAREHGFEILDHKLKFYGLCKKCKESDLD